MEKNKKLKITDTSGKTSEYDIITAFFGAKTKKTILYILIILKMKIMI